LVAFFERNDKISVRGGDLVDINEAGVSSASVRYIFTPSSFAEQMFYYPTRIGHYFCDRRYHFSYQSDIAIQPGHIFNYMIFFMKNGQMDITIDGEQKVIEKHEVAIFDCQKPYEYRALTDNVEFYWLLFNGGQSTLFHDQLVRICGSHIRKPGGSSQMEVLFTHLLTVCESEHRISERVYSEKIYSLLCQMLVPEYNEENSFSTMVDKAIAYVEWNLDKELTVDDVASYVGLSTSYFTKQFRLRTGYSPYEYLIFQRIQRAKELLVSTDLTVQQIGFQIGYNSEDNFIKSFKKKVGVSPNVFRKFPV